MERPTRPCVEKIALTAFLVATVMTIFLSAVSASSLPSTRKDRVVFREAKVVIFAERADSPERKTRGLMFRTSLSEKEGMLFPFEENTLQRFWMYNTTIPLTIIFLDDGLRVVDIQDMRPCFEKNPDRCPIYTSRSPARYAVEVSLGFAKKHGIRVGQKAAIERAE